MANFGVSDLRLVNPCQHLHPEARKFAVSAAPLLGTARLFPSLEEAIGDLHTAVAATRRGGQRRGAPLVARQLPELLAGVPALGFGLVLGREDSGLTSAEVALCTHTVTIPSEPERGSLNLAQATLLLLYEIYVGTHGCPPLNVDPPAPLAEVEPMLGQMELVLNRIAFLNPEQPDTVLNSLRRIFQRAALSGRDVAVLRGMWSQLAWSIRDWRGRKRGEG
ncbi:tRNA (cytidine/uridine-2'-O-)-methyltransferase TrmJ [Desulfuromonas versatilis]|uniref:tRNA (Cytidine/uridine-2'-O-)-methyltransferase TrmJ n=2 Tax=Desulfuromonas versatilis TaxID=2802975 RepID=A0ABM8HVJ3_9BACT|nr:tRNA (cytidine/uridine-2'-O-)-methyltransferase TrmJ [Desulfuromonas versatilis]